jgi:polyisoprenoid-binding protein YceI
MKKSAFSALFFAWAITQAAAAPEKYEINPINSFVLFKLRFLWASNISGCFCGGVSGMVSFDPAVPEKSTVELDIKTDTLDTGVALLNKDIKSPDFLNMRQFHSITFKSKSVRKVDYQQYMVIGDLTLHGITKPLTLRADLIGQGKDPKGELHAGADIRLMIRLSEFGVKYQLPALGDDVFLTIGVRN